MKRDHLDHKFNFPTIMARLNFLSAVKILFVSLIVIGVAFVGVTASVEVVNAALGSENPSDEQITNNLNGKSMALGIEPGMRMSPMMNPPPIMMNEAESYATPAAVSASGGDRGRNTRMAKSSNIIKAKSHEQVIREEGGYNAKMGADVLNSGDKSKYDPLIEPMLIRNGNIQATTGKDFTNLQSDLQGTILNVDGAYIESSYNNGGWKDPQGQIQGRSISMQVRVPVDMFFNLRDSIVNLFPEGEVGSVSDSVNDITSQYIDAAARATTLRATLEQLTKLMTYAETVDAVLKVQRELSQVTQQLEAKEATMKRLSSSAALSTLSININQKPPPFSEPDKHNKKEQWSIARTVRRASRWLTQKLINVVDIAIFASFALVPLTLLGAVLYLLLKRMIISSGFWFSLSSPPLMSEDASKFTSKD